MRVAAHARALRAVRPSHVCRNSADLRPESTPRRLGPAPTLSGGYPEPAALLRTLPHAGYPRAVGAPPPPRVCQGRTTATGPGRPASPASWSGLGGRLMRANFGHTTLADAACPFSPYGYCPVLRHATFGRARTSARNAVPGPGIPGGEMCPASIRSKAADAPDTSWSLAGVGPAQDRLRRGVLQPVLEFRDLPGVEVREG